MKYAIEILEAELNKLTNARMNFVKNVYFNPESTQLKINIERSKEIIKALKILTKSKINN